MHSKINIIKKGVFWGAELIGMGPRSVLWLYMSPMHVGTCASVKLGHALTFDLVELQTCEVKRKVKIKSKTIK